MTDREERLETLRIISERLEEAERVVHDFTATSEGMDVVLSAPPSMRF